MVIYAFIAEQSLGALFLAGIFPGLLMAALMMLLIYVASKRGHYDLPALPRASRTELGSAFRRAFLPLLAPTILVGGILFGIFTPTEAGVVVVVYVLLIGSVFLKFEIGHIRDAMMDTMRTSAATLFIIAASMIFGWIVVVYRVSDNTLALLSAHIDSPSMVMLFIVISMMLLGMFLEGIPVQVLTVPTFMMLASRYDSAIPHAFKHFAKREFSFPKTARSARCDNERQSGPNRIAACLQCRSARCAARFDKELRKAHPLAG